MTVNTPQQLPLRDIHLPESVSWWPLAPGWWLVLLILFTGAAIWRMQKRRRQRQAALRTVALRELARIEQRYCGEGDLRVLLEELSVLVRRVAISLSPREQSASLTGEIWLQSLDRIFGGNDFTQGIGRALASVPYMRCQETDVSGLLELCRDAFKRLPLIPRSIGEGKSIPHA